MSIGVIHVSSAAELSSALSQASGGETIVLAAGNYGTLKISGSTPAGITVKAETPGTVQFNRFDLDHADGVSLEGLTFAASNIAKKEDSAFRIHNSTNVTIADCDFTGMELNGYPAGKGLTINRSTGVTLLDSSLTGFWKGIYVDDSAHVLLQGNTLTDMRSDGLALVDSTDIAVIGNHIHNFRTNLDTGDHPDLIQLFTSGTGTIPKNILIHDNLLERGDGGEAHAIFLTQSVSVLSDLGAASTYSNITVTENVILNSHPHGITVGLADGLTIANNTLLDLSGGTGTAPPQINLSAGSTGVQVTDNVTFAVNGSGTGWTVANNFAVQDKHPQLSTHYDQNFINPDGDELADLQVLPGSPIAAAGSGATRLQYDPAPDSLAALLQAQMSDTARNSFVFDAGLSAGPNGMAGALYHWDFGDGSTSTAVAPAHLYMQAGHYDVTLTVTLPDGSQDSSTRHIDIQGPDLLEFSSGAWTLSKFGVDTAIQPGRSKGASLDPVSEALVFVPGDYLLIPKAHITPLYDAESFALDLQVSASAAGEVMRLHQAFRVDITGTGELKASVNTADGQTIRLTTQGADLMDGGVHDISVQYDGGGDGLTLMVDGATLAQKPATGGLPTMGNWDMSLGSQWAKSFTGAIHSLDLDANPTLYAMDHQSAIVIAPPPEIPDEPDFEITEAYSLSFDLDLATAVDDGARLTGQAAIAASPDGPVLEIRPASALELGRMGAFEDSDQIVMSVDFARETADGSTGRLVWNQNRLGVSLADDGLKIKVGTSKGFKQVTTGDLGLNDTEQHELTITVDATNDVLRAFLDGELVLDHAGFNIELGSSSDYQWGWTLGSRWNNNLHVQVDEFELADYGTGPEDLTDDWSLLIG